MFSVLILGLLIGLQHAAEADHLAAVASLTTQSKSLRDAARHGGAWGLGHSLMIFIFGGTALALGNALDQTLALWLETAVGGMLVLLGADVLRRMLQQRMHFHRHRHGEQTHFHAHSHAPGRAHDNDPHNHRHAARTPLRSLVVGMVHGMAGSAALIVFALGSVESTLEGLLYLVMFGIGSLLGMSAMAVVISLPLQWSARRLTWTHNSLTAMMGLFTIGLGILLLHQTIGALSNPPLPA